MSETIFKIEKITKNRKSYRNANKRKSEMPKIFKKIRENVKKVEIKLKIVTNRISYGNATNINNNNNSNNPKWEK